jgi:hypothetical protein
VADIGNKPASNYYAYHQMDGEDEAVAASETRRACTALMYSGTCRGISAKSQLVFLNEYAKINNINIMGSESQA